jgi:hypothetical protein
MVGRVLAMATMVTVLGGGRAAYALCNCTDTDTCGSAVACAGANPGDACSPPSGATCKVVEGNPGGLSCCCGCSKGAGPLSCVFDPVIESLPELGAATCGNEQLEKANEKAVTKSTKKLKAGQEKCQKGKTKGVPGKLNGAQTSLEGVGKKLDRLVEKGEIDEACANGYRALANEFLDDIDDLGNSEIPAGSTTSTSVQTGSTTSTSVASSDCTAAFSLFSDPNEVDILITCPPGSYTGFTITPAQPRMITNFLTPTGFSCSILAGGTFDCLGSFPGGTPLNAGRIRTSPPPVTGMGGTMTVLQGPSEFGPFPVTGP